MTKIISFFRWCIRFTIDSMADQWNIGSLVFILKMQTLYRTLFMLGLAAKNWWISFDWDLRIKTITKPAETGKTDIKQLELLTENEILVCSTFHANEMGQFFSPANRLISIILCEGILHSFNQANAFLLDRTLTISWWFECNPKEFNVLKSHSVFAFAFDYPIPSGMAKWAVSVADFQHSFYCVFTYYIRA